MVLIDADAVVAGGRRSLELVQTVVVHLVRLGRGPKSFESTSTQTELLVSAKSGGRSRYGIRWKNSNFTANSVQFRQRNSARPAGGLWGKVLKVEPQCQSGGRSPDTLYAR